MRVCVYVRPREMEGMEEEAEEEEVGQRGRLGRGSGLEFASKGVGRPKGVGRQTGAAPGAAAHQAGPASPEELLGTQPHQGGSSRPSPSRPRGASVGEGGSKERSASGERRDGGIDLTFRRW